MRYLVLLALLAGCGPSNAIPTQQSLTPQAQLYGNDGHGFRISPLDIVGGPPSAQKSCRHDTVGGPPKCKIQDNDTPGGMTSH